MQPNAAAQTLSPALLCAIQTHWLEDFAIGASDANRRIQAYEGLARRIAAGAQKQLVTCGAGSVRDWLRHRALVVGYVNGMSESLLQDSGETSRWAIALVSLSALMVLLGSEWDEDAMCTEGQRLWRQKNPAYLVGLRAAETDHTAIRQGGVPTGLAATLIEREMRIGAP